jgi:hypothetical protein
MLLVSVIGPWIGGVVAIGFMVGLMGFFRPMITGVLMIVWQAAGKRMRPAGVAPIAPPMMAVAGLGGLAAVVGGGLLPNPAIRLVVAVGVGVLAFVLGRRQVSAPAAVTIILGAVLAALALHDLVAWASDGGYFECSGNLLNCPGIDGTGRHAITGGGAAAGGAVVGGAAGGHKRRRRRGGVGGPGGGSDGQTPCEADGALETYTDWEKWQSTHPTAGGGLPDVGSESWRDFMAHRTEFHRQAADIKLTAEWDKPLDKIKGELQKIDDQLVKTKTQVHYAQVAVNVVEETANLDSEGWNRLADAMGDDLGSGEAFKRAALTTLKLPAATVVGTYEAGKFFVDLPVQTGVAAGWWYQNLTNPSVVAAAYSEFGKAQVDQFTATMATLGSGDRDKASTVISNVAGSVAGGELLGFGLRAIKAARDAAKADRLPASAGDIPEGGIPLDTEAKRAAVGHSEGAAENFQATADRHDVRPQMERRNPDAIAHEGDTYMKSEGMKDLKSLNAYNESVGGPGRDSSALLGLYEPKPPPFWASRQVKEAFNEAKKVFDGIPGDTEAAKRAYIEGKTYTVYENGVKKSFKPKFDEKGIMRNAEDGKAVNTDYDGWDTLDGDGSRSLGYNADGSKVDGALQRADRARAVGAIKDLQEGAVQAQHSNRTRLWDPPPQLEWGGEQLPCFSCKLPNIATRKAAKVASEGVVEYRPGSVDTAGKPVPWLTHGAGTTPPPPTPRMPGMPDVPAGAGAAAALTESLDDGATEDGDNTGDVEGPGDPVGDDQSDGADYQYEDE